MAQGFMTQREAAVALVSHYTHKGPENGSFATKLIEAFEKADRSNTARLLIGFPEFSVPLKLVTTQGIEGLEVKLKEGYFDVK